MSEISPLSTGANPFALQTVDQEAAGINVNPPLDFETWDSQIGSGIPDREQKWRSYANYHRMHWFDKGVLSKEVELNIRASLKNHLLEEGFVNEDTPAEDIFKPEPISLDKETNLVARAFGENVASLWKQEKETGGKEEVTNKTLNDAKAYLVDTGDLPFASLRNLEGERRIIGGDTPEYGNSAAFENAVLEGAVTYDDAILVQSGLRKGLTEGNTRFREQKKGRLASELSVITSEKGTVQAKQYLDNLTDLLLREDEGRAPKKELHKGEYVELNRDFLLKGLRTELAQKYAEDKDIRFQDALKRFSDKEVNEAAQEQAAIRANFSGEFKYYSEESDVNKNIRFFGEEVAVVHPQLMLQPVRFEKAITSDKRLTDDQRSSLRNQREVFRRERYASVNEVLKQTKATSEKWIEASSKGVLAGEDPVDTLDAFLSDENNYNAFKNQSKSILVSIGDSFTSLYNIPAALIFKSESAAKRLAEAAEEEGRRREVAKLFNQDYGLGMDVLTLIAPVITDIGATVALSSFTMGAGGAAYIGLKTGTTVTAKGLAKGLTGGVLRKTTSKELSKYGLNKASIKHADDLLKKEFIRSSSKKEAAKAVRVYNEMLNNKLLMGSQRMGALFATSANRSAGGMFTSIYSSLPADMTHEEKYDAAIGSALLAGTVTGLITTGFMKIGKGGLEEAFLDGMTYRQMKGVIRRQLGVNLGDEAANETAAKILNAGMKKALLNSPILEGTLSEAVEEGLDELAQTFIRDAALNEDSSLSEIASNVGHSMLLGGIMGGGATTARKFVDKVRGPTGDEARFRAEMANKVIAELRENDSPLTADEWERQETFRLLTAPVREVEDGRRTRPDQPARPTQPDAQEETGAEVVEVPYDGTNSAPMVQLGRRAIVFRKVNGVIVPFYLSSGMAGKPNAGKWVPIFGVGRDAGWFNKGPTQEDIDNYYGSPALKRVAESLDEEFGDIRVPAFEGDVYAPLPEGIPPVKDEGHLRSIIEENLGIKAMDIFNSDAEKRANISSVIDRIEQKRRESIDTPEGELPLGDARVTPEGELEFPFVGSVEGTDPNRVPEEEIAEFDWDRSWEEEPVYSTNLEGQRELLQEGQPELPLEGESYEYQESFLNTLNGNISPETVQRALEEQLEFQLGTSKEASSGVANQAVKKKVKTKSLRPDERKLQKLLNALSERTSLIKGEEYVFPTVDIPVSKEEFIDDNLTATEVKAFEELVRKGVPVDLTQDRVLHGMPDRSMFPVDYYKKKSQLLKELIELRYPKRSSFLPEDVKNPIKDDKGKVIGYLDEEGNALFDNDPVKAAKLMLMGYSIKAPSTKANMNPAFVYKEGDPLVKGVLIDGGFSGTKRVSEHSINEIFPTIEENILSNEEVLRIFENNDRPISIGTKALSEGSDVRSAFRKKGLPQTREESLKDVRQQITDLFKGVRENEGEKSAVLDLLSPSGSTVVLESDFVEQAIVALEQEANLVAVLHELNTALRETEGAVEIDPETGVATPTKKALEVFKQRVLKSEDPIFDAAMELANNLPVSQDDSKPNQIVLEFLSDYVLNDPLLQKDSVSFRSIGARVFNRYSAFQTNYLESEGKFYPKDTVTRRYVRLVDPSVAATFDASAVNFMNDLINDASAVLEEDLTLREAVDSYLDVTTALENVEGSPDWRTRVKSGDEVLGIIMDQGKTLRSIAPDSPQGKAFLALYKKALRGKDSGPVHTLLRIISGATDSVSKEGSIESDIVLLENVRARIEATVGTSFSTPQTIAVINSIRKVATEMHTGTYYDFRAEAPAPSTPTATEAGEEITSRTIEDIRKLQKAVASIGSVQEGQEEVWPARSRDDILRSELDTEATSAEEEADQNLEEQEGLTLEEDGLLHRLFNRMGSFVRKHGAIFKIINNKGGIAQANARRNEVSLNQNAVAHLIQEGHKEGVIRRILKVILGEEVAHVAAYRSISKKTRAKLIEQTTDEEFDAIVDEYTPLDTQKKTNESLKEALRSEDPTVVQETKERMMEEKLRMYAQNKMRGTTSEANWAFWTKNPTNLQIVMEYFRRMISNLMRMKAMNRGSSELDMAVANLVEEIHTLKGGDRLSPNSFAFNPNTPDDNWGEVQSTSLGELFPEDADGFTPADLTQDEDVVEFRKLVMTGDSGKADLTHDLNDFDLQMEFDEEEEGAETPEDNSRIRRRILNKWLKENPKAAAKLNDFVINEARANGYNVNEVWYHASPVHSIDTPSSEGDLIAAYVSQNKDEATQVASVVHAPEDTIVYNWFIKEDLNIFDHEDAAQVSDFLDRLEQEPEIKEAIKNKDYSRGALVRKLGDGVYSIFTHHKPTTMEFVQTSEVWDPDWKNVARYLSEYGYDGFYEYEGTKIDPDTGENVPDSSKNLAVFKPNNIKSADPVTFKGHYRPDDETIGQLWFDTQVVPLDQRFDDKRSEIQFSELGITGAPIEAGPETDRVLETTAQEAANRAQGKLDEMGVARVFIDEVPNFVGNYDNLKSLLTETREALGDTSRGEMPIIQPQQVEEFGEFLNEKLGDETPVSVEPTTVRVSDMKPYQTELFFPKTVWYAMQRHFDLQDATEKVASKPFSVMSSDGYILDGNHRFGQIMLVNPDQVVTANVVNLTMEELLPYAKEYSEMVGNNREIDRGGQELRKADLGPFEKDSLNENDSPTVGRVAKTGIFMLKSGKITSLAKEEQENFNYGDNNFEPLLEKDLHITLLGPTFVEDRTAEGKADLITLDENGLGPEVSLPNISFHAPEISTQLQPDGTLRQSLVRRVVEQEVLKNFVEKNILGEPSPDTERIYHITLGNLTGNPRHSVAYPNPSNSIALGSKEHLKMRDDKGPRLLHSELGATDAKFLELAEDPTKNWEELYKLDKKVADAAGYTLEAQRYGNYTEEGFMPPPATYANFAIGYFSRSGFTARPPQPHIKLDREEIREKIYGASDQKFHFEIPEHRDAGDAHIRPDMQGRTYPMRGHNSPLRIKVGKVLEIRSNVAHPQAIMKEEIQRLGLELEYDSWLTLNEATAEAYKNLDIERPITSASDAREYAAGDRTGYGAEDGRELYTLGSFLLEKGGYDTLFYKYINSTGRELTSGDTEVIVKDPNQIKFAGIVRDSAGDIIPPSQRYDPSRESVLYSELGATETKNVELGERAYRRVEEAAKEAGYKYGPVYHGTPAKDLESFDYKFIGTTGYALGPGFYFTDDESEARLYTKRDGVVIPVFLKINNARDWDSPALTAAELLPVLERTAEMEHQENLAEDPDAVIEDTFIANFGGMEAAAEMLAGEDIINEEEGAGFREASKKIHGQEAHYSIAEQLGSMKGSGMHPEFFLRAFKEVAGIDGLYQVGTRTGSHRGAKTIVFTPEQIKSADQITHDKDGNVIPLSERFDESKESILYSQLGATDAKFLELAENPTKNAKALQEMVDERAGAVAGVPFIDAEKEQSKALLNKESYNRMRNFYTQKLSTELTKEKEAEAIAKVKPNLKRWADAGLDASEGGRNIDPEVFLKAIRSGLDSPQSEEDIKRHFKSEREHAKAEIEQAKKLYELYGGKQQTATDFKTGVPFYTKVSHATPFGKIKSFDPDKLGEYTGAPSAEKAFFFAGSKDVAETYFADPNINIQHKGFLALTSEQQGELVNSLRSDETLDAWEDLRVQEEALGLFPDLVEYDITPFDNVRHDVFVTLRNPLVVDQEGSYREESYFDTLVRAEEGGHDGVVFANTTDSGPATPMGAWQEPTNIIAVLAKEEASNQIKSADPVTYDDNGNVIPLSERFDESKDSILYSELGATGKTIAGYTYDSKPVSVDKLTKMLELSVYETGVYDEDKLESRNKWVNKWRSIKKLLGGALDIRARRLVEQREAFNRAIQNDVQLRTDELKRTIDKDFIDKGKKVPYELISASTGSTKIISIPEDVKDSIDQRLKSNEAGINERAKRKEITEEEKNKLIESARAKHKEEISKQRDVQREIIRKERDNAITELNKLSPDLVEQLKALRDQVDELSIKLKELYGTDIDLSVKIDNNLGIYLTRAYKMFNDPDWMNTVLMDDDYDTTRKNAVKYFEDTYKASRMKALMEDGKEESEAEKIAQKEIDEDENDLGKSMMYAFLRGYKNRESTPLKEGNAAKKFASPLVDQLRKKTDVDEAIRALLGEYTDEGAGFRNLLRTYLNVGLMASNQAFMKNILQIGRAKKNEWILTRAELDKKMLEDVGKYGGDKYEKIEAGGSEAYDPFRNFEVEVDGEKQKTTLYAPKEMVEGLKKVLGSGQDPSTLNQSEEVARHTYRLMAKTTGISLGVKTLGSIGFYVRNVVSNMFYFGPAQGFFRFGTMTSSLVDEMKRRGIGRTERVSDYHSELIALNIIGSEIRPKLIEELLSGEASAQSMIEDFEKNLSRLEEGDSPSNKGVVDKAKEMSAIVDAFYKIALFEHELKYLIDARAESRANNLDDGRSGLSDYDLKRLASHKVVKTSQTFDQSPPLISGLQGSPFGVMFAPFIRFKGEVIRTYFNTWSLAFKEAGDVNPVIKRRGRMRLTGITGVTTVAGVALPIAARALVGITHDDEEALRDSMPPYLRGSTFLYRKTADGKILSYSMTYVNPYSLIADPALRAIEYAAHGDSTKAAIALVKGVTEEFLDEQIFLRAFLDVTSNKDRKTEFPIWEENDDLGTKAMRMFTYIGENAIEPPTLTKLRKAKALGYFPPDMDVPPLIENLVSQFHPSAPHELDLEVNLSRFLKARKHEYDRFNRRKNKMYTDEDMTKAEVQALARSEVENRRSVNEHILRVQTAFERMGLPKEEIYSITKDSGMGKQRALLLMKGMMDRPVLTMPFIERMAGKGERHVQRLRDFNAELMKYKRHLSLE